MLHFFQDFKSYYRLQQCEEDKQTKDSQIRSLKEELASQEDLVAKLQKEKKVWADGRQQKEEELQAAEDKANHLTKIKMKLEQNLDELEDSVEREKKVGLKAKGGIFIKVKFFGLILTTFGFSHQDFVQFTLKLTFLVCLIWLKVEIVQNP